MYGFRVRAAASRSCASAIVFPATFTVDVRAAQGVDDAQRLVTGARVSMDPPLLADAERSPIVVFAVDRAVTLQRPDSLPGQREQT